MSLQMIPHLQKTFGDLAAPDRTALAGAFEEQEIRENHIFGRVGLVGKREQDTVWIVLEGRVGISTEAKTDSQVPVHRELEAGEIFGIVAFLRGGPRTATAWAITPVKVAALSQERYQSTVRKNPVLNGYLLLVLARQLARDVRLCNERLIRAVIKTQQKP